MSIYQRLTRHSKHELDQKRKQLGFAIKSLEASNQELKNLEAQRMSELELSSQVPDLQAALGGFLDKNKQKKNEATVKTKETKERIQKLERDLYDAFQTHMRYESAASSHQLAADNELKLKTQAALDELGLQKHFREKKL